ILAPKSVRPARAHFIVTSEPVRSREEWDAMKGVKLYVPLQALPEIDDDEVYVDELLGVSAIDPDGLVLGRIKAVQNYGAGDLLEISPAIGGKSVLIPFTQEDVPSVDINAGQVTIASWALWSEDKDS
ncbi:MAG: ribosome maturation factor RimM, partial [Pseudomonadota bacterium]